MKIQKNSLNFGLGEISTSKENKVFKSTKNTSFDYLLFFDSRAMTIDEENHKNTTLTKTLNLFDKKNISYLAISRPKNLTIFATLLNFLELNKDLKFKNLITNLGFVDFTPKKQENIADMLLQINQFFSLKTIVYEKESYMLNGGGSERMKILEYSKDYALYIEEILKNRFENVFLINTPIVPENIQIERQRPKSFFKQLYVTNKFIENIILMDKKFNLIDIKNINHTFDAVHYTSKGHNEVFLKIIKKLNL